MLLVSTSLLALGVFLITWLALHRYILQPLFLSPLSKIPSAHCSSPFSPLWILLIRYRLKENRTVHALHQKYGPILRLGPNEISINTIDNGVKTIYGGGFEKGDWYSIFDNYGVTCTFSALPSKSHSATKRMVSHTYSALSLFSSKALAAQSYHLIYRRLLPHLHDAATRGPEKYLDVLSLFYASSMDAITAYQFGLRNSSNMIQDEKFRKHFLDDLYQPRKVYAYFGQEIPRLKRWLEKVGIRLVPKWVDAANEEIEGWCQGMCRAAIFEVEGKKAGFDDERRVEDEPVVVAALLKGIEKEEKKENSVLEERIRRSRELMVCTEMLDHLAAGHETSGITLTYMAYHLSKDLGLQKELRKELRTLDLPILYRGETIGLPDRLPDPKQIDCLPLLHAIMMETLRLNAAIPGSTPRVTPYPSCNLAGYQIPDGVRVSSSAWCLHRNAEVFPNPERWDHTRWLLDESGEKSQARREMDKWYWAFSSGGRMCLGNNFAIMRKFPPASFTPVYHSIFLNESQAKLFVVP